ncbi:MAG TPA: hypothetical protein VKU19_20810 [Bryobacteraceae bacterium]|nr:hypothetical protein [Bryobacteraceae bacterium]
MLSGILAPINAGAARKQTAMFTFRQFVGSVYPANSEEEVEKFYGDYYGTDDQPASC